MTQTIKFRSLQDVPLPPSSTSSLPTAHSGEASVPAACRKRCVSRSSVSTHRSDPGYCVKVAGPPRRRACRQDSGLCSARGKTGVSAAVPRGAPSRRSADRRGTPGEPPGINGVLRMGHGNCVLIEEHHSVDTRRDEWPTALRAHSGTRYTMCVAVAYLGKCYAYVLDGLIGDQGQSPP